MPRRNRNGWRNDQARADAHQQNVVDLNGRRQRSKRARRLEKKRRAA